MLVVANGAPKSGSTWLFNIVQRLCTFSNVPEEYLVDRNNPNSEIHYDRLEEFLETVDYRTLDYIVKNHFGTAHQRDALLQAPDVLVINIKRDLKDAVVSGYYHNMRQTGQRRTFDNYYWKEGRFLADHIRRYHRVWEENPSSRVLMLSYERLSQYTASEIVGIARFLGRSCSAAAAQAVVDATSLENLRTKYSDNGEIKFFRKGQVGVWENYFSVRQLVDIEMIEQCGLENESIGRRALAKGLALAQR